MVAGVAGEVMRKNKAQVVDDLREWEGGCIDIEGVLTQFQLRSAVVVPVRQGSEVLGALYFAAATPQAFTPEDVQMARLLAAGLSGALENARLYQSLADERSTLAAVLESTRDAIIMVNQQGVVLLANPAVTTMRPAGCSKTCGARTWRTSPRATRCSPRRGEPGQANPDRQPLRSCGSADSLTRNVSGEKGRVRPAQPVRKGAHDL